LSFQKHCNLLVVHALQVRSQFLQGSESLAAEEHAGLLIVIVGVLNVVLFPGARRCEHPEAVKARKLLDL
jgi:hypothetical protein